MTIGTWFDILFEGMKKGFDWLMAIDIGGISLGNYIIVIFITGLLITLFLNVVNTGFIMGSNMIESKNREERRAESRANFSRLVRSMRSKRD